MPPHPPPWASASPILISVVPLSVPLPPTLFFSLPSRSPPTLPLAYDARRLSRAGVFYVLLTAKTGPPMRRAARAGASRAVADQDRSHAPNPISMLARGSRTPFSLSPRRCLSREERPELCPVRAWALGLETTRQATMLEACSQSVFPSIRLALQLATGRRLRLDLAPTW